MADPTQNDENKKPVAGDGSATKKEEVSAADLLSLWGGGAQAAKPSAPKPEPPKPEPAPTPKIPITPTPLQTPKPKPKPKPAPKPEPPPEPKFLPQPVSPPPAPKPAPSPIPVASIPASELKPAAKIDYPFAPKSEPPVTPSQVPPQPPPAFWEIPKSAPPSPLRQQPVMEEPIMPKSKPIPPPPPAPAFIEEPAPKPKPPKQPLDFIEEPAPKPKPPVKIDKDIFEQEEKAPMSDVIEGEVIKSKPLPPVSAPAVLDEDDTFGSQIDEFLAELNLSRKHIFYGIGCLILIIVLIIGGIWGYKFYKDRAQPQPEQKPAKREQQKSEVSVPETSTGVSSTQEIGKLLDPNLVGATGVNSTSAVGIELTGASGISSYIMTFKRLQNAYETDINELLNQATDRRGRLNSHLALLGKFYVDGALINSQIRQEAEQIKIQYEEKKKVQQTHDSNFFDQIKALNPQTTENILSDFINVSKEIVVLRARFKALQKVKSYYDFALPKLNARIKDIELNAEALILGLKVYDVKGSDLKLIIPIESSAGATQNESLESSSGVSLFINPASVDTGHDYITKPGGGF